jgi:hypothetical protein
MRANEMSSAMSGFNFRARIGLMAAALAASTIFSSVAMAAAGCGDDGVGDIGDVTPIALPNNQSFSYDFTHCFGNGGDTAGWNHTQSPAPAHGTLQIVGSVVKYTPNPGYVGPDFYCLSCLPGFTIGADGAMFDACSCNLTATFQVDPPVIATPALSTWALTLLVLMLVAMSLYRLGPGSGPRTHSARSELVGAPPVGVPPFPIPEPLSRERRSKADSS